MDGLWRVRNITAFLKTWELQPHLVTGRRPSTLPLKTPYWGFCGVAYNVAPTETIILMLVPTFVFHQYSQSPAASTNEIPLASQSFDRVTLVTVDMGMSD